MNDLFPVVQRVRLKTLVESVQAACEGAELAFPVPAANRTDGFAFPRLPGPLPDRPRDETDAVSFSGYVRPGYVQLDGHVTDGENEATVSVRQKGTGPVEVRVAPLDDDEDPPYTGLPPGPEHDAVVAEGRAYQCFETNEEGQPYAVPAGTDVDALLQSLGQTVSSWLTVTAPTPADAAARYWDAFDQWHARQDGYPAWMYPDWARRFVCCEIEKTDLPPDFTP